MSSIKSKKKDPIITASEILGFIILFVIAVGTLLIYIKITTSFTSMKTNMDFYGWSMNVKTQILLILKGDALIKFIGSGVFNYDSATVL